MKEDEGRTSRDTWLDLFGRGYSLGGVALLCELELLDFSMNETGKIMKIELLELVIRYLKTQTVMRQEQDSNGSVAR